MTSNTKNLADVDESDVPTAVKFERLNKSIFNDKVLKEDTGTMSYMEYLLEKAVGPNGPLSEPPPGKETVSSSLQGVTLGRKFQPFNMRGMSEFQSSNPHHGTCIQTKKTAIVGLGFRSNDPTDVIGTGGTILNSQLQQTLLTQNKYTPQTDPATGAPDPAALDPQAMEQMIRKKQALTKADKVLNPLCTHTFYDVLLLAAEDFVQVGNGYIEVVRLKNGGKIVGIHHIPAADVFIYLENYRYNMHYEVLGDEGVGGSRHFPKWGDTESFLKRLGGSAMPWFGISVEDMAGLETISEVIHFKNPSSRSRWYGFPDWLSCVSKIELGQCLDQFKYDFFLNRGVPEFIFLLTGAKLQKTDWDIIDATLKANIGLGNSHKSCALNLPNKDIKAELFKLALDAGEGLDYVTMSDSLAMAVVTAHRVPPLLAGIQIPGKLGANNELPNALMAFQVLVVGPMQRSFQQTLAMTFGDKATNAGLGLVPEDFLFRTITEEIDVGTLDTQSRMRQTVPEAKAQGRDLKDGVKD